ncbi:MAG: DUF3298 domain-containing protein [Clostridia bacterium]|nr:DUF3298 domain-containing protein [Clostridia bacterium]
MKKKIAIISLCVAIAAVSLVSCSLFKEKNPNGDGPDVPPVVESGEKESYVMVEPVTIRNNADHIMIENVYPSITSFSNKEFENYINKTIAANISEYRSEINHMVDDETLVDTIYTYTTNYEKYVWGDYLTLIVNQDYQTGGIRSNTWKEIYNINIASERIIYLEELFRATVDYEDAIIREITEQAAQKNYVLMGGDGLKKLPMKQKFYIRDGKLVIYYDPSEIAANKYGALEFEMPFTLDSEGFFEIN